MILDGANMANFFIDKKHAKSESDPVQSQKTKSNINKIKTYT